MTDAPDAPAASESVGPGPAAPWSWPPEVDPHPPRPVGWRRPQPARPAPAPPVDRDITADDPADDPADGPVCRECGGRHPTPGGRLAARLLLGPGPGGRVVDPRTAGIPGWGRRRHDGGSW
jgi:hypothetical protein